MARSAKVNPLHLVVAVLTAPLVCLGLPLLVPSLRAWLMDASEFVPRTDCGTGWTTGMVSWAEISDTMIFMCYVVLSVALFYWYELTAAQLSRREAVAVAIWSAFVFACGLTHLTGRMMFGFPCYRLDTLVRSYCALASVAAVVHAPILLRMDTWFRT